MPRHVPRGRAVTRVGVTDNQSTQYQDINQSQLSIETDVRQSQLSQCLDINQSQLSVDISTNHSSVSRQQPITAHLEDCVHAESGHEAVVVATTVTSNNPTTSIVDL